MHLARDTLGYLSAVQVTPANEQQHAQVRSLVQDVQHVKGETVKPAFFDQGYTGEGPTEAAQMETTSMSLSKQIAALLLYLFGWRSALAAPSVCPIRQNQPLRSIDAFDGEPQDLATLEPDVAKERDGHWVLGYIYDEGRFVTMRCKYADKQTQDVTLANRVEQCSYSINARNVLRVTCK